MSNPIMNKIINRDVTTENVMDSNNVMTVDGTVNTTLVMGLLLITSAVFTFTRMSMGYTDLGVMLTGLGAISAFILALIIIFTRAVTLVPFYGIAEGLFLGGVSAMFELSYPGVVVNAVAGTFAGAEIKENYSNATVRATINSDTGKLVNLVIEWNQQVEISKLLGMSAAASGVSHVTYKDFKY